MAYGEMRQAGASDQEGRHSRADGVAATLQGGEHRTGQRHRICDPLNTPAGSGKARNTLGSGGGRRTSRYCIRLFGGVATR